MNLLTSQSHHGYHAQGKHRPHHLSPSEASVRLVLVYKNSVANYGISHTGLGVAAMLTAAVLRRLGFWVDVWAAENGKELEDRIVVEQANATASGEVPISHVVIGAPWVSPLDLQHLAMKFPSITLAVVSHSNVAFLGADVRGIDYIREMALLTRTFTNFHVGGNCKKFAKWLHAAYDVPVPYLPNLYDTTSFVPHKPHHGGRVGSSGEIQVGCFGANRPLKNSITAAGAVLAMSKTHNVNVAFHVNVGRPEGSRTLPAIKQMLSGRPRVRLVEDSWRDWSKFRELVGTMDILLQPSFTESFNLVTADGVAEGVPSAVSDALEWVPSTWMATADDAMDLAQVAMHLLQDPTAINHGRTALQSYVTEGERYWVDWLMHPC